MYWGAAAAVVLYCHHSRGLDVSLEMTRGQWHSLDSTVQCHRTPALAVTQRSPLIRICGPEADPQFHPSQASSTWISRCLGHRLRQRSQQSLLIPVPSVNPVSPHRRRSFKIFWRWCLDVVRVPAACRKMTGHCVKEVWAALCCRKDRSAAQFYRTSPHLDEPLQLSLMLLASLLT